MLKNSALAIFALILTAVPTSTLARQSLRPAQPNSYQQWAIDAAKVMKRLHAAFGITPEIIQTVMEEAVQMTDPQTGLAFRTKGGYPLPYFRLDGSGEVDCSKDQIHDGGKRIVLVIGGIHGNEIAPINASMRLLLKFLADPSSRPGNQIIYVPLANPDGLIAHFKDHKSSRRYNLNKVDLNRDFHSENPQVETRFIKRLIDFYKPDRIVSIHGPYGWLDYDGPALKDNASAEKKAEVAAWMKQIQNEKRGLRDKSSFKAYEGSLGDYAGTDLGIDVLTFELPTKSGKESANVWRNYEDALVASMTNEKKED